ncbi:MAG TPA: proton-translocating NADH-quinone oxidoreductase subunit N, partial [Verrucomicrobiales bacterium]|nr:proton-translocating NADH-quinone oxidoreductase subunit N [Verrucomicrobiales bacterium]
RRSLAYVAATGLLVILTFHAGGLAPADGTAFAGMFVADALSNFFKTLFLVCGIAMLLISASYSDRLNGFGEFVALVLFALVGMLLAASANDFILMFVALELITVTFYVLVSFQRHRLASLEAGVKYLIFGALAAAFMVFGITLIFGASNTTNFYQIAAQQSKLLNSPIFLIGLLLTFVGLGFKISAVPFQMWTPDVYQGAPAPTTAFLASGSKAAGMVLIVRLAYGVVPDLAGHWSHLLLGIAVVTALYGSFCALAQRSVKRLMGYSSIANAGYLLIGVAATNLTGSSAVLFFLTGYLVTTLLVFAVMTVVTAESDSDDISIFDGLGRRSPFLAAGMTLGLVSLAGVPPLAGFFGKFWIFKSAAARVASDRWFLVAILAACVAVVISLYYYFGIIRAMYWPRHAVESKPLPTPLPTALTVVACVAAVLLIGVFPGGLVQESERAVAGLAPAPEPAVSQTAAK